MGAGDIYTKTSLGVQEVSNRKMKLSPRLRTMLILIDGRQPALILKEEAEKVGAPDDFLEQLVALQLVIKSGVAVVSGPQEAEQAPDAPAPAADEYTRFRAAKDFMNSSVVNALGIKSFFFTLKLERAGNVADLRGLVDGYREAISKGSGPEEAEVLTRRLKVMLA
jgi:hypothetical protein